MERKRTRRHHRDARQQDGGERTAMSKKAKDQGKPVNPAVPATSQATNQSFSVTNAIFVRNPSANSSPTGPTTDSYRITRR